MRRTKKESILGPRIHTSYETVLDAITDQSTFRIGCLETAGNIYADKTGNPQKVLTVAERDRE
jgi:hypothetical protein